MILNEQLEKSNEQVYCEVWVITVAFTIERQLLSIWKMRDMIFEVNMVWYSLK